MDIYMRMIFLLLKLQEQMLKDHEERIKELEMQERRGQ